ncbi:MAG: hypothetical protein AABY74_08055, partial [Planctomycetota bacterium]
MPEPQVLSIKPVVFGIFFRVSKAIISADGKVSFVKRQGVNVQNLYAAFKHVKKNKGTAGLDRVSIQQFESDLEKNI